MKNALNYYYNLNPTSIHQINKDYKCYVNNDEYILKLYDDKNVDINKIHELSSYLFSNNIPCHQIVSNISNQLVTTINNNNYILLRIFIRNRTININDIKLFSHLYIDKDYFKELVKNDWYNMWTHKVDYFEYQISQFGKKYPLIRESFSYYIGLAENSISLFSGYIDKNQYNMVVSHHRIEKEYGLIELYNPLNFIIDNSVRDLAEYIKGQFFFGKYNIETAIDDISKFDLNQDLVTLLFIRLIYPSYYFDCYDKIMFDNKKEEDILKIINRTEQYRLFLKELYYYLRRFFDVPELEWIIKT